MRFDIITIFPELFSSFISQALIARAIKKKIIAVIPHDLRQWTSDAHRSVDGRPYGGGPGMVLLAEPIIKGLAVIKRQTRTKKHQRVVLFSAKGKTFIQSTARRWAQKYEQITFICGRYEGIDERIADTIVDEEISIGDYVLFGGELPAMVAMEAVTRLLPSAMGKEASLINESFKIQDEKAGYDFLEYPHYTRPEKLIINGKKKNVPKVLLSGNHGAIAHWRDKHTKWRKKKLNLKGDK